jgi:hypothetical protein
MTDTELRLIAALAILRDSSRTRRRTFGARVSICPAPAPPTGRTTPPSRAEAIRGSAADLDTRSCAGTSPSARRRAERDLGSALWQRAKLGGVEEVAPQAVVFECVLFELIPAALYPSARARHAKKCSRSRKSWRWEGGDERSLRVLRQESHHGDRVADERRGRWIEMRHVPIRVQLPLRVEPPQGSRRPDMARRAADCPRGRSLARPDHSDARCRGVHVRALRWGVWRATRRAQGGGQVRAPGEEVGVCYASNSAEGASGKVTAKEVTSAREESNTKGWGLTPRQSVSGEEG